MPDNISPEEKLFKIIHEGAQRSSSSRTHPKTWDLPFKDFNHWLGSFKFFWAAARVSLSGRIQKISLHQVNLILSVVLAFFFLLVSRSFLAGRPDLAGVARGVQAIRFPRPRVGADFLLPPESFYLEEARKRDIFQPIEPAVEIVQEVAAKVSLEELAADFKLQGISWGEPAKAMIKSNKEDKIYFLLPGQPLGSSGIKVKKILKDKVFIEYENKEMELL